jgi:stearoyl-CoA 9-desaturase NADPH oxidoreductase
MHSAVRRILRSPLAAQLAGPHGVDRYLDALHPLWSVDEVRARIIAVDQPTADSLRLRLRTNANWRGFRAGQYLRLTTVVNGVRRTRCYSPANAAGSGRDLELTLRVHAHGQVSRHLRHNARPGTVLSLSQAEGEFALPDVRPDRILLISGGSGITPVLSMLRTLLNEGYERPIGFIHYARCAQDMLYAAELAELAARHPQLRLVRAFSEGGGELHGRFSRQHLETACPEFAQAQTFLCGPAALTEAVQTVFTEQGLADRLHLEHFTAAPIHAPAQAVSGAEVRFSRSERWVVGSGASLLDQAEAAGLRPDAGCRRGICHSCTCRKTAGRVRDLRTGALSDSGEEDIQLCITAPEGPVTLDL